MIMTLKPLIKWAGGKTKLLKDLVNSMPENYHTYYEPFIGGGSLFLKLMPERAIISDMNSDLICMYQTVKDHPEELIKELLTYKNTKEEYLRIRNIDRDRNSYEKLSPISRSARLIYLTKTCFNGLYRVNSRGEFNTSFGKYKNPLICDSTLIRDMSNYFNNNNISFVCKDFSGVSQTATSSDFVYFDPPYYPISSSSNFTSYTCSGFSEKDQIRLKEECDRLTERGVKFLLSNSSAPFILELYKDYKIKLVETTRTLSGKADTRGKIKEILVANY